ncbi:MAG: CDGSH iron-sulfur domain-containing protein [Conexibacter sp.]
MSTQDDGGRSGLCGTDVDPDERCSPVPMTADVVRLLAAAGGIARRRGRDVADVADVAAALGEPPPAAAPPPARITPYRDGPYLLRGPFELVDQDGAAIATRRSTIALCRCGRSQMRPFCDGTHKLTGFQADSGAARRDVAAEED